MKAKLLLLLLSSIVIVSLHAADPAAENSKDSSADNHLRHGLFEEEANQNYEKARAHYRAVVDAYQRQRTLAASATFRLGELARKANDKTAAASSFQAVIEQFPEQKKLVQLSSENLTALGKNKPAPAEQSANILELVAALQDHHRQVEEKRKALDDLLLDVPATIRYDLPGINGETGTQGRQSNLEKQFASEAISLASIDNIIEQIEHLGVDEAIHYVANLEIASQDLKALCSEYQKEERILKGLLAQGLGENHPSVTSQRSSVENLFIEKLQKRIVSFTDSLKKNRETKAVEHNKLNTRLKEVQNFVRTNVTLMNAIHSAQNDLRVQQETLDIMRKKLTALGHEESALAPATSTDAKGADADRQEVVNIGGFVRAPGAKPYTPGMTLHQAIAASGDANEFGDLERVTLTRDGTIWKFDVKNSKQINFLLLPNDTIEIPEKSWYGHGLKASDFAPSPSTDAKGADAVQQEVVTIRGSVRQPGSKPYTHGLTLYQAIIAAGGATEFGDLRLVVLTRGKIHSEYDLTNLEHRSVIIKPDDVIEVPAKPFAGQ